MRSWERGAKRRDASLWRTTSKRSRAKWKRRGFPPSSSRRSGPAGGRPAWRSCRRGSGPGGSSDGGSLPRRVIAEYLRRVRGAGRNARLYLYGLFLWGLGQSIFTLLFNLYLRELGYTDSGIGQILSKVSLGAAVAALPVAFLFRRIATQRLLVVAGALASLTYLLQGTLAAPELLLLAAFVSGIVVTIFRLSIAPVVMREVSAESRPYLFSAAFTVFFLSAIVGSILGGALPNFFHLVTEHPTHPPMVALDGVRLDAPRGGAVLPNDLAGS